MIYSGIVIVQLCGLCDDFVIFFFEIVVEVYMLL